jgi:hypothetical protein
MKAQSEIIEEFSRKLKKFPASPIIPTLNYITQYSKKLITL